MKQIENTNEELETQKTRNPLKLIAIVLSSLAAVLVLAVLGMGFLFWYSEDLHGGMFSARDNVISVPNNELKSTVDADWIDENGNAYNYRDDVITILLMGVDYMGNEKFWDENTVSNGGNADVLALVMLDTNTFEFSILYIPRDTITDVIKMDAEGNYIDTIRANICTSHSYGDGGDLSCKLTADAVSRLLLGVPVQRYASLHCDAISVLNDIVGGVRITFDSDCTDLHHTFTKGNTVTLNNLYLSMLITYRDYDIVDGASTRGMRIMNILQAMFNQLKEKIMADPTVALDVFNQLTDYITTDLKISEITYLARNIGKMDFSSDTVIRLPGETVMGEEYAEFHADQEWIRNFVIENFCVPVQ